MIWGVLVGLAISLLNLFPGIHPAGILLMLLPSLALGTDGALAAAAVSTGAGSLLHVLNVAYQPMSRRMIAGADVATKLAYQGYGPAVVRLHTQAVWMGFTGVCVLGALFILPQLLGHNSAQAFGRAIGAIAPWVLAAAIILTIVRADRKISTVMICGMAAAIGFVTFNCAGLAGNPWAMTPLLSGLFMAPIAASLLVKQKPLKMQADQDNIWETDPAIQTLGSLLGCLTGFLAGIGTSSVVALVRSDDMEDEDYLSLGAAADSANSMFALLAYCLIGSTRSGTAAALAEAAPQVDAIGSILCLGFIALGLLLGHNLVAALHGVYRFVIHKLPQRTFAAGLLVMTTWLVITQTGASGLLIYIAAWLLSTQARAWYVPNQALLVSLTGPVLIYYLGLSGSLATIFGLMH